MINFDEGVLAVGLFALCFPSSGSSRCLRSLSFDISSFTDTEGELHIVLFSASSSVLLSASTLMLSLLSYCIVPASVVFSELF